MVKDFFVIQIKTDVYIKSLKVFKNTQKIMSIITWGVLKDCQKVSHNT